MRVSGNNVSAGFVVGLDCSTTSTKAIAFDRSGIIVSYASEPIPLSSPQQNYYEQDSGIWWRSTKKVLRAVTHDIDPGNIAALAISNQRETFVPLDGGGKPLRSAILWLDERCKDVVEQFARQIGKNRIHRITGKPADYAPVVYRLAWMKINEPNLFREIGMVCDVHSYLAWKLTGSFKTSWASADPLGLFDMRNKKWSTIILKTLGLKEAQLPEAFSPGSVLGKVSQQASEMTGLSTDTLVISGGGDGQAAGLGSNVLAPQRAYLNLGTAVVAGIYGTQYRTNSAFRTMCSCSDSGYNYECSLRAGTFALDWLIKKVLMTDPERRPVIYKELEKEASRIPPGSDGLIYLPYLSGVMNPYWNADARGAFIGLSPVHTRGHLYRSILEGIAFEQRLAVELVERAVGTKVKEFVAIGGGAANQLWCSIIADTTDRSILIPNNVEASALGAAVAAAVGSRWYTSFREAAMGMTATKTEIKPDMNNHEIYKKVFERYKQIYPALRRIKSDS